MKDKNLSRRTFVKGSAIAASGLMLGSSLTAQASAFVGGADTLKLALVGCGGRGTGAARQALNADEGVQLVAMADAFPDAVEKCYETLSKVFDKKRLKVKDNKFSGFGAYKKAIDMADVVILTTPPGWRPEHFEYAVSQGKHIFMEKPLATDAPGIRRVLEAAKVAKQKNLNVVVGLQRHYQKSYKEVYERLQNGAVGDIVAGQVYWNSGGVWVRERQPAQTEMEYQMRNWYYFNWLCGDHINEQHIHNIDVANWFIGDVPMTAQGMGGREVRKGKDHGQIFDHHFVEFVYPSGAVVASQCRHIRDTMSKVSEAFQGTKGSIYTDSGGVGTMKDYSGKKIYSHDATDDKNPYQVEHDELFASIREGGVINNVDYGAKSTMTAIMGRMATYSGKLITWDEALNSNQVLVPKETDLTWESMPPVSPDKDGNYPVPVPGSTQVI